MNKTARGLTAAICLKEERGMKRPSPHRCLRWVGFLLLGGVLAVGAGGVARAQSPGVGKSFATVRLVRRWWWCRQARTGWARQGEKGGGARMKARSIG